MSLAKEILDWWEENQYVLSDYNIIIDEPDFVQTAKDQLETERLSSLLEDSINEPCEANNPCHSP